MSSNPNTKFGAKEVMDVTLYDMLSGNPVICFDTLKTSSISVTSEKVYARGGKGNPKIITWEINKEATLTIEDALISPKSMELISGMATKIGARTVYVRQDTEWDTSGAKPVDKGDIYPLTCSSEGVINLAFTPKETAENIKIYLRDDDCGTLVSMTDASLSTNVLTLGDAGKGVATGKKVIAYYTRDTSETAQTYVITSDKFSGTYKLVGDTVIRNAETGLDEPFQVIIPNLKWTSNLELGFSAEGDPSTTTFECEIMRESGGSTMIEMIKYD